MDKLVFIVDDTESILIAGASILENDFRVLTMSSAEKMFSLLAKKSPDLIILDIEMPGMSGLEALAKLRDDPNWKDTPVLLLTGHIDENVINKGAELGACEVIHKTDMKDKLLERVKECLE